MQKAEITKQSKFSGCGVIVAGGELHSGPAARSAVQIQAQQDEIGTATSQKSTGPHPDARSISPRHRRPHSREWPLASSPTRSVATAIQSCAVCQSGFSLPTGIGAKLKGTRERRRRLPAHALHAWPHPLILHPHSVHPRRERFTRDGSSLAQPGTRSQPTGGSPIWRTRLSKSTVLLLYIIWDG